MKKNACFSFISECKFVPLHHLTNHVLKEKRERLIIAPCFLYTPHTLLSAFVCEVTETRCDLIFNSFILLTLQMLSICYQTTDGVSATVQQPATRVS